MSSQIILKTSNIWTFPAEVFLWVDHDIIEHAVVNVIIIINDCLSSPLSHELIIK